MAKGLLEGKRGIIFGALDDKSIAWKVAERCYEEGGVFILSNAPVALRFGKINDLAAKCSTEVVGADATNIEELKQLYTSSMEKLGGKLDFVLHSIGMSLNVRKNNAYTALNHDFMLKTLDISALSFHKVMQAGLELDAYNEWASIVGLSYIAAQRAFPSYSEMAEAKATLESIARSFGYHLGKLKKVRVNTISQSPTPTTAGSGVKGFSAFMSYAEKMSPLGNATAEDCANYCVALFSDYTRKVTMQNLFHDGGFSMTGVSEEMMHLFGE
jgi:enoyl-[acyl-carrier protein] reductase I